MSSKTLFVWLVAAIACLSMAFLPTNSAFAQLQFGTPTIECVDTGGEPGVDLDADQILLTVTATYSMNDFPCDSARVGLDPEPGLGVLTPALVATETFGCPTEPVEGLYVMNSVRAPNTGFGGVFELGTCLVTSTLQFHPECVSSLQGDWLPFNITWRTYDGFDYVCVQRRDSVQAPCDIETDCCIYLEYAEYGGFKYDGIIAIGDSVWLDSANVALFDSSETEPAVVNDTVFADLSGLTGSAADFYTALGDTIEVVPAVMENNVLACSDTIWLFRAVWDEDVGDAWPADAVITDTLYCVRRVDNLPPELTSAAVDSFAIINGNYFDNDTLAGCGDVLRVYLSTLDDTANRWWEGTDTRGSSNDIVMRNGAVSCSTVFANWDVDRLFADLSNLSPIIGGDQMFPFNTGYADMPDSMAWSSATVDSVLMSASFFVYGDPLSNDILYLDIPIDTVNWDSIEWCLLEEILAANGYVIDLYSADDAGNLSNVITPAGDSLGTLAGWDICLDTWAPQLPGNDIIYLPNFCGKRFSPYDSALATFFTNLSPDSIQWYLDKVGDNYFVTNEDRLQNVYLIGFDVRSVPDDDPDTPTGGIVTWLDYYNPAAEPDSNNWTYYGINDASLSDSAACFIWYGKDGPDSLDPNLGLLSSFCPWGMLVGLTEARYMDAAGCNAVLGSDHDGQTSILEGYTQLNALYSVVDTCAPDVVEATDILHLDTLAIGSPMPFGPAFPDSGLGANDTYLWTNGDADPVLEFRAERFFTQGLFDTCLAEQLCYRIRVDSVFMEDPWAGGVMTGDSGEVYYAFSDSVNGSGTAFCDYIPFEFNDIYADSIRFTWGHEFPDGSPLTDGLYRVALEIIDDAGNVYQDPLWIWINGVGPTIDTIAIVNDAQVCNLNFFIGESLCVWMQTDTSAASVLIDWSCIFDIDNIAPDQDSLWLNTPYDENVGLNQRFWFGSIYIQPGMIDTVNDPRNMYEIQPIDGDCQDAGYYQIGVTAFDSDSNYTLADPIHNCDKAILGLSRCPRIVGLPSLHFYDPDSLFDFGGAPAPFVDVEFDTFDVMPWWNAISPGSVDSAGAYNSVTNPAHDNVQDSIFVRILLDTLSITHPTIGADTVFTDTLVLQFVNMSFAPPRIREIRKPLFIPTLADMSPSDWPFNEIYDGRLERDETNAALAEFRYQWNGSWYEMGGADSIMLVPPTDQDTIIIRAFTIDGDSFWTDVNDDTTYLICDTLIIDLDVDNINPTFVDHTLIAPGLFDPETHTTSTVENLGWDGDCGFRYADGDTFNLRVVASEQVHFDSTHYPNDYGSHQTAGGAWTPMPHWNISLVNHVTEELVVVGGDTIQVWMDEVTPTDLGNGNWQYDLVGHFANVPPDTFIYDACFVIRGAWDQAGNPGRWNNPVYNDAFESDSFEDTTFCVTLISCDPWADGCPDVYGPDLVMGWIAPEDTNIVVNATIIETCEITECAPGVKADSALRVQGNFQVITDDPDPWVIPDSVGAWFIYFDGTDTLGWARMYYWTLRADSSDLATIWCDGDFLPFWIRFESVMGVDETMLFENCVQVDVNEPIWTSAGALDTLGDFIDVLENLTNCINPEDPFWIYATFTEDSIDCATGAGVGVMLDMVWADLSVLTNNAANDSIVPDSLVYDTTNSSGIAYWLVQADPMFFCLDTVDAWIRFLALHDSVGHHDRELYLQEDINFCSDCVAPYLGSVAAFCDCAEDTLFHQATEAALECLDVPLGYLTPGDPFSITACLYDVNSDSSLGLAYVAGNYLMDGSPFDPALGWITPADLDTFPPYMTVNGEYMAVASWGIPCLNGPAYWLNETYDNGDTIFTRFRFEDAAGNFDTTGFIAVAIVDTFPAIVDYVYTIGDDSIRAYVTPGDDHVHIYADITGGAFDLVAPPANVWADLSQLWCGGADSAAYDTVYAHEIVEMGPNWYRAYWGWTPSGVYQINGDTLSQLTDTLAASPDLCNCLLLGAEGWYDSLFFYVEDEACNTSEHYSIFEVSGCDSTVPALDSVWVWGNGCGTPGWISSSPMDSGHIEVWAWMDTVFNELADTLKIDSLQINLAQLSASRWGWTQWSDNLEGGWELEGTTDVDSTFWSIVQDGAGRDRLVGRWVFLTADELSCGDSVVVGVKSIRQTGLGGAHGYYVDVEYGTAFVDDTPPYIYDMRVYSSTTSIAETSWVSPNYPLYIEFWATDSTCSLADITHLGWDLTHDEPYGGPGPYISFDTGSDCDTLIPYLWTFDTTAFEIAWVSNPADTLRSDSIRIRFVGTPNFPDSCNFIDFDDLAGCVTAHIEDCLSNPADPVTKTVVTDDRPPEYVYSVPWGDYTYYTGFPGNPDLIGIDSVLVLAQGVYALDWDSVLVVNVVVDNAPGDTLMSWLGTYIDFSGFMNAPNQMQFMDEVWYNIDGNNRDSLVWYVDLYDGGGPLWDTSIPSDRYWFPLLLSDSLQNRSTLFCADLDSSISFTIQNWLQDATRGMVLLCDSSGTYGTDSTIYDVANMLLWNNEKVSPDLDMENLYKIYTEPQSWSWFSHEEDNMTRFFVFVEDTVLQNDGIDNDADGLYDEIGEGVDFYTADLRINSYPQVAHVDSMNVDGVWINYLWYADNFSERQYNVDLFISDIYGHRDTLRCGETALTFWEDETCPYGTTLKLWYDGEAVMIRLNEGFGSSLDLTALTADDSIFVSTEFDSIEIMAYDPFIFDEDWPIPFEDQGSGVDVSTSTAEDSSTWNGSAASTIEILDPSDIVIAAFTQTFYADEDYFSMAPLTLTDLTDAIAALPDGNYTIRITTLDRVGNSCEYQWTFVLDRECPTINDAWVSLPGSLDPETHLMASWDYVEIHADVEDALDGIDSVSFEYAFDANRDGEVDVVSLWQTINILNANGGGNVDSEYPWVAYWNIRNLPWSSEDTLGLPPVNPDSCVNTYFVRVHSWDIYGHECIDTFAVDIEDDIAPLAYVYFFDDYDWIPGPDYDGIQSSLVRCFNPNTMTDSMLYVCAQDWIDTSLAYDPLPGDTFTVYERWFDLYEGVFQYKFYDAPNDIITDNDDPALGWVNLPSGTNGDVQDTIVARSHIWNDFCINWNMSGVQSGQYNLRIVGFDVCNNYDYLNTPVVTFRVECDTTAPLAVICEPDPDACVTNYRCDEEDWVLVKSSAPTFYDVDSVAFYFVDSLSTPGLGIHTFIGGSSTPDSVNSGFAIYHSTMWNTENLLTGWYWLYVVAWDDDALFDTDPMWTRVWVDNTAPEVTECWIGNNSGDPFEVIGTIGEGETFYLRGFAEDNIGLEQSCGITAVQFQYLGRFGNWRNLPNTSNVNAFYGADVFTSPAFGYDTAPDAAGYYEVAISVHDFGSSPLDSIRFRAYAIDNVDYGDNNIQGDRNRDCTIDRDLDCGEDICCMAIEIIDALPNGTILQAYNNTEFECCVPSGTPIVPGDCYSTCNGQNTLDNLLLMAFINEEVDDESFLHFKFWRSDGSTDTLYVPNDVTLNPGIPAIGPIPVESTWDTVFVIWTGARAYFDSANVADGLYRSEWCFVAYVEDLTGNLEEWSEGDPNTSCITMVCMPQAPITHASYVTNDVENPDNRVRVFEPIPYADSVTDTIEVIYNRTTDPGSDDPEALVLFYTDEDAIVNCYDIEMWEANVQLWLLDDVYNIVEQLCFGAPYELFNFFDPDGGFGWDQFPPDADQDNRYVVGFYFDNSYPPGTYNFAMIANDNYNFSEGNWDLSNCNDEIGYEDKTRIDLVVRIVNVNEPQVVICTPEYGDVCGAHNTVSLTANDVSDPDYFSGEIDTVWFEYYDGDSWEPVIDPWSGTNYDADPTTAVVLFEFDENELPGMAGWYYERHSDPQYSWYAERDLFPDIWVYIWETDSSYDLTDDGNGFWTRYVSFETFDEETCYSYSFVIDANDNGILDDPGVDRWVDDPRDPCTETICQGEGDRAELDAPCSEICLCEYMINFASTDWDDGHWEFRTVVGWHDDVAYHVIENPAPGDSLHVFFVDNDAPVATHDIEFDRWWLNGGRCAEPTDAHFVTDIQPVDGDYDLVVEDICQVIYQVSLTNSPWTDSSWVNVDTVLSNEDMGWTEAWPSFWTAYDPTADNIDNDGDGLVDETYDVQGGDGIGEENMWFYTRSVVVDYCGNTYSTPYDSVLVDVSEARACISQVGDVIPGPDGSDVVVIPGDRDLAIIATNQDYAGFDPGILGVFQYRRLNPITGWVNIEADTLSDDTVRHVGDTFTAVWDLLAYHEQNGFADPEGWFQLRVITIDTVDNDDMCDNDVCYITIRLNDIEPASRVEIYGIWNDDEEMAQDCQTENMLYVQPSDPYCVRAIFAPTDIDTGLASLTFQYADWDGEVMGDWRNIETIWDHIDNGLNGDTTECVYFQPRPEAIGENGFKLRVIVEDYNGNDTTEVVTLWVDETPPTGLSDAAVTIAFDHVCETDRCRFDNDDATVTVTFDPDPQSGELDVEPASVHLNWLRDDEEFGTEGGFLMEWAGGNVWTFDFDGDLCDFWTNYEFDMGCYNFWVSYEDCAGNADSINVTTDCGDGDVGLVCIDCIPELPDHAQFEYMDYSGWDCVDEDDNTIRDAILDGNTEIGNQTVQICGSLPDYQQYIASVQLFVESIDVPETMVDEYFWTNTSESAGADYCFDWDVAEEDSLGDLVFPSGYYKVWVLAVDAICQIQDIGMADTFWVHVDNAEPIAEITGFNGDEVVNPAVFEMYSGDDHWGDQSNPWMWVEWADGLTPDDSIQTHNQVRLYAKNIWYPNATDTWYEIGETTSPCNPHYVDMTEILAGSCGDSLHIVAIAQDRWGNGDLDVERAMAAFDEGRYITVYIYDTVPPQTVLWSVGTADDLDSYAGTVTIFDQQNFYGALPADGHTDDVWLHTLSMFHDPSIDRVYFEYSLDGETWFEIGVDESSSEPAYDCSEWPEPLPWWCEFTYDEEDEDILWAVPWDISGLAGDILIRSYGEDECGNFEEPVVYTLSIDVMAPMAEVFVWENGVNIDNLETCDDWTETQIGDDLERYTALTVGACADESEADAYGAKWYIKRADDHPLNGINWCMFADDSTGPFSADNIAFWDGNAAFDCYEPEVGTEYDVAVLTTDQVGNELTWNQFLNYSYQLDPDSITYIQKWNTLIANGYVKRFLVVDSIAPVAHSISVTDDCTPDSSMVFVHDDVYLEAVVEDPDVVAVTWAFLEVGSAGPWTVIERVEGDSLDDFSPVEGYWNTELLNGTFLVGAFAEDFYGNVDGDLSAGEAGAPANPLLVNVDNEMPDGWFVNIYRSDDPGENFAAELERGQEYVFHMDATDNFGVRNVALSYRHSGGDPDNWILIGTTSTWPYSITWTVDPELVVGWNYDFAAIATDMCYWTDEADAQGDYIVDWSGPVVDNEANISIASICGENPETTPHLNGTDICLVAHSEPTLDYVRFLWIEGENETLIGTVTGTVGQTVWTLCGWDVTTIPHDTEGQLCAVGVVDEGGGPETVAEDCRNVVIDHSLPYELVENGPVSGGLVGGYCEAGDRDGNDLETTDDVWVLLDNLITDAGLDSVWFEWKDAADPDQEEYWMHLDVASQDDGLTGNWRTAFDFTGFDCGWITLRVGLQDNTICDPNREYVTFADSVRVDNCDPVVEITNVNGDFTPDGMEVRLGEMVQVVATAEDVFGDGGNSDIAEVCFYGDYGWGWDLITCDDEGPLWSFYLETSFMEEPGQFSIRAVTWDEAGNCSNDAITINLVDGYLQSASIIGFDYDCGVGCDDKLWAISDDCDENVTDFVIFEVSEDQGQIWAQLGDSRNQYETYCDGDLGYRIWDRTVEFDEIAPDAWFRVVAYDEAGNADPNPPIFRLSDVDTLEDAAVVYAVDWVQLPVEGEETPWVFSMLENFTESGGSPGALVCVEPGINEDGDQFVAGPLHSSTSPCVLDNEDGRVSIFETNCKDDSTIASIDTILVEGEPVIDTTWYYFGATNVYWQDIHRVDPEGGSNGWVSSEDNSTELYIPDFATDEGATVWFQSSHDDININLIPQNQYYYSWLSGEMGIMSNGLTGEDYSGTGPFRAKMYLDTALVPAWIRADTTEWWRVVAAYWDAEEGQWLEYGIYYEERDLVNGMIDFHGFLDYDASVVGDGCPDQLYIAVFLTTIQPITEYVLINNGGDCVVAPDMTYYTEERGPTVDCTPDMWVVLGEGEYPPTPDRVDVWMWGPGLPPNGLLIVNDGVSMAPDDGQCDGDSVFDVGYDDESGLFMVRLETDNTDCAPFYGCFPMGQYGVQFIVDDIPNMRTPFFVDQTAPEAFTEPGWINDTITLWADLTDPESGIDTTLVYVNLYNCDDFDVQYDIHAESMTFTPIENGYRAEFTVQWDAVSYLWAGEDDYLTCINTMCVEWEADNFQCLHSDGTRYYTYTMDQFDPQIWPISPVGDPIDNDNDGVANEDWYDCINQDNDFWWDDDYGWRERLDEDIVDFEEATFNCGERQPIQATIKNFNGCCWGSSPLNVELSTITIDGIAGGWTFADLSVMEGLNFSWTYDGDDVFFTMGGPSSDGDIADLIYAPGQHNIVVTAIDEVGNIGTGPIWEYYVECPGPAVAFDYTECGLWFNPEGAPEFSFIVSAPEDAPIQINGINYSVYTMPDHVLWSGPTTIDPDDSTEHPVNYVMSGSWPAGQTGLSIEVETRNIYYNAESGNDNGYNFSALTYWVDNCSPSWTSHVPEDDTEKPNDQNIVIEVFYTDDCESTPGGDTTNVEDPGDTLTAGGGGGSKLDVNAMAARITSSLGENARIKNLKRVSSTTSKGSLTNSRSGRTLDDGANGSGVIAETVTMTITPPFDAPYIITEVGEGGFIERDIQHVKYVLTPPLQAGLWCVNVHIEDCVGNVKNEQWCFTVLGAGPDVTWNPVEGECQFQGYWNPDHALNLNVTVCESDNVNLAPQSDIQIDVVGVFVDSTGVYEEVLLENANFNQSEAQDPENRDQCFVLTGEYTLDFNEELPTDVRIRITAVDQLGAETTSSQTWVVDNNAPTIEILSPLADAVVSGPVVTIQARFLDDEDGGTTASFPGGTDRERGVIRVLDSFDKANSKGFDKNSNTTYTSRLDLGKWRDALTRGLDELDGDSGVDPECIELLLMPHDGSATLNLTGDAQIQGNQITWIGSLDDGVYTAIITVCDQVCNTAFDNWSFVVGGDGEWIVFEEPYYVSAMPHAFEMTLVNENIDVNSLGLNVEGSFWFVPDSGEAYEVWSQIAENAAILVDENNVSYTANFDLNDLRSIRLTMSGMFNGDIQAGSVTQNYTVDISAPVIVSLSPEADPELLLEVGSSPTFEVRFEEVGNTALDAESVVLSLSKNGVLITDAATVELSDNARTGRAYIRTDALAAGDYALYFQVEDVAGNRTFESWNYEVGEGPQPPVILTDGETFNYPNPFTPSDDYTTFVLPLSDNFSGAAFVQIKIYDLSGRFVATIQDGNYFSGDALTWNGRSESGDEVANGVYLAHVKINAGGEAVNAVVKVAYMKESK